MGLNMTIKVTKNSCCSIGWTIQWQILLILGVLVHRLTRMSLPNRVGEPDWGVLADFPAVFFIFAALVSASTDKYKYQKSQLRRAIDQGCLRVVTHGNVKTAPVGTK